jgi:competence protein ComEC
VGEIWDSGLTESQQPDGVLARFLGDMRARGVPVRTSAELCGSPQRYAGAVVRVLAPCPRFEPSRGANDNSLVIHLALGSRSALLTGDAEEAEEAELLEQHGGELRADFLKVGHHGSRTSTSLSFVAEVRPSVAAISCGVRNRFGHPHQPPLAALQTAAVTVLRTDRGGAILWETDGEAVRVHQMATWEASP